MCGIVGVIGAIHAESLVGQILKNISYRGPHASGTYAYKNFVIGMNRLWVRGSNIIDVPIKFKIDKKYYISAYNGQVYAETPGLEEVKAILKNEELIDGMYAACIYHFAESYCTVYLIRDEFGIKPLFYSYDKYFSFCSELLPLTSIGHKKKINYQVLKETFIFGMPLSNKTIYQNIYKVMPGDKKKLDIYYENKNKIRFCSNSKIYKFNGTVSQYDFRKKLQKALRACADTNKTVGLAISGGLDSTILAYELNEMGIKNLKTISLKIENSMDGINELEALNLPSSGAWESWQHHTAIFSASEFPKYLEESVKLYGQPHKMTSFPLYLKLADLAKSSGIDVLITGEGADEIFMGYESYKHWYRDSDKSLGQFEQVLRFYISSKNLGLYNQIFGELSVDRIIKNFKDQFFKDKSRNILLKLNEIEKILSLEPLLLRNDICLMSRSIEGRVPFLHNGIPHMTNFSLINSKYTGKVTKPYLRDIYRHLLDSYNIPKRAFRAPLRYWFKYQLHDWLDQEVSQELAHLEQLGFEHQTIKFILKMAKSDTEDYFNIFFILITTLMWIKLFRSQIDI